MGSSKMRNYGRSLVASESPTERLRILAVDDEPALLDVYRGYLTPEFSVTTAASGEAALDRIDDSFDVILLDRRMPDMTGEEVLGEIRARGIDTPVAMLTAVNPDVDIVDMPFDEYLEKPVERTVLIDTIKILAKRSRFEARSREFFRLATKKASLAKHRLDQDDYGEFQQLVDDFRGLEETLDETIGNLFARNTLVASTVMPDDDEEVSTLLNEIHDHALPAPIRDLIEQYQKLDESRPPFVWKWVHQLAPQNSLPCVDAEHRDKVAVDKTLVILFVTLLDDLLEKRGDRSTFRALAGITQGSQNRPTDADEETVAFGRHVWDKIESRLMRAPNYDHYAPLYRFDVNRAVEAIEYSDMVIHRPELATMGDLERYESHNMVMFAYADIDLMHSSRSNGSELSTLRDAIWTAQQMARIGNWVSTWERELKEGDFSAGPIVYALEEGVVGLEELQDCPEDPQLAEAIISRIHEHEVEKYYLSKWERHYHELCRHNEHLETVDLEEFIEGTKEILRYHLASRGLK